jgi:hypothetical protein
VIVRSPLVEIVNEEQQLGTTQAHVGVAPHPDGNGRQ